MGLRGRPDDRRHPDRAAAPTSTVPQAGWYADPVENDRLRYFDGIGWTDWVRSSRATITSRPPGRRLALVAGVTVAVFGSLALGAIWLQTPDLAHASASARALQPPPAPQSTPIAPQPTDPTATPPAAAGAPLTCEDLYADAIEAAREQTPGQTPISIVTLHDTAVVEDHYAELVAGTLVIAPGQTEAVVLACRGIASAADGEDYPVEFTGVVDARRTWSVHVQDAPSP